MSEVLLITGGAGGIGAAVARRFAAAGGLPPNRRHQPGRTMFGLHAAVPALAAPDEVADAVLTLAGAGVTGEAWTIQAGAPPAPFPFPMIDMPRTV